MTDSEKIDKIYDFVMEHNTDIALLKATQQSQSTHLKEITETTESFTADRNKIVGAAWVGGTIGGIGGLAGIGSLIINFFKHHI